MQPKVSVIVPIYNAEKYIESCCRSLFEQTLDCIEYIFINDCTPDNSIGVLNNIANEYPDRLPFIHIINHESNQGQSGARKSGMAIATGEYIIHCDADDWVDLEMYETMYLKAIETGVEAICCDMVMEYSNNSVYLSYNSEYDDHQLMYDCLAPISVVYCSMCNRLVSSKLFKENKIVPFSGVNMWDDVGLTTQIRYHLKSSYVINKAFYHYNRANETSTTQRPPLNRIKEQIKCVENLELFFIKHKCNDKYNKFITYLKLEAKKNLMEVDYKLWLRTFPETKKQLKNMVSCIPFKILIKYYILYYGKKFGANLLMIYHGLKK